MRGIRVVILALAAAALAIGPRAPAAAGADKSTELKIVVAQMKTAGSLHAARIEAAKAKRGGLVERVRQLREEIAVERRRSGPAALSVALKTDRVAYNLKLIQQLFAYIDQLELRVAYFQAANLRLDFLMRQAEDDLMMLKTFGDADTARLTRRIRDALGEHALQAEKPLIVVSELRFRDLEAVWKECVADGLR